MNKLYEIIARHHAEALIKQSYSPGYTLHDLGEGASEAWSYMPKWLGGGTPSTSREAFQFKPTPRMPGFNTFNDTASTVMKFNEDGQPALPVPGNGKAFNAHVSSTPEHLLNQQNWFHPIDTNLELPHKTVSWRTLGDKNTAVSNPQAVANDKRMHGGSRGIDLYQAKLQSVLDNPNVDPANKSYIQKQLYSTLSPNNVRNGTGNTLQNGQQIETSPAELVERSEHARSLAKEPGVFASMAKGPLAAVPATIGAVTRAGDAIDSFRDGNYWRGAGQTAGALAFAPSEVNPVNPLLNAIGGKIGPLAGRIASKAVPQFVERAPVIGNALSHAVPAMAAKAAPLAVDQGAWIGQSMLAAPGQEAAPAAAWRAAVQPSTFTQQQVRSTPTQSTQPSQPAPSWFAKNDRAILTGLVGTLGVAGGYLAYRKWKRQQQNV